MIDRHTVKASIMSFRGTPNETRCFAPNSPTKQYLFIEMTCHVLPGSRYRHPLVCVWSKNGTVNSMHLLDFTTKVKLFFWTLVLDQFYPPPLTSSEDEISPIPCILKARWLICLLAPSWTDSPSHIHTLDVPFKVYGWFKILLLRSVMYFICMEWEESSPFILSLSPSVFFSLSISFTASCFSVIVWRSTWPWPLKTNVIWMMRGECKNQASGHLIFTLVAFSCTKEQSERARTD